MYPEFSKLTSWVEHKHSHYIANNSVDWYWYSFQDIPWEMYMFKNDIGNKFVDNEDLFLSVRYMSIAYSKSRTDLPLVKFTDKDRFTIECEVVVKSEKKCKEYVKIVDKLIDIPIDHDVTYDFNKECIGQRILWTSRASDLIAYLKHYYRDTSSGYDMDYQFIDYCASNNIDMEKINYSV